MTIVEISRMSITERLQIMEDIWDSLIHDASDLESPSWHGDVLAQRRQNIQAGQAEFITINELKSRHGK